MTTDNRDLFQTVSAATGGDTAAFGLLASRVSAAPLQKALFPSDPPPFNQHLHLFETLAPIYHRTLNALEIDTTDTAFLFDLLVPLTQFLGKQITLRPQGCLIGLGGGPGAGKSTLSRLLAECLPVASQQSLDCLSLSIDDFYRPKEERLRRGFKWRTLPGTHDTERLAQFVAHFDQGISPFAVPRYDLGRDAPGADEQRPGSPDVCIFDGAMVGSTLPGYACLAHRIDVMIYLDADISLLRRWRFDRERRTRERSGGAAGFSPAQMRAFWNEALKPSIAKWVQPNAKTADLVIEIGPGRAILGARKQGNARQQAEKQLAEALKDG